MTLVTHVKSASNQSEPTAKIFREQENEKKRVLEVENGISTPLVFGTNDGMGVECTLFRKISESYAIGIAWLRTRLSFEILRSVYLCVRGSRAPFRKRDEGEMIEDFQLNVNVAGIFGIALNFYSKF